jgi:hypothetical protein
MDDETIKMLSEGLNDPVEPRTPPEAYPDMDMHSGELQWANSSCLDSSCLVQSPNEESQ